MAPFYKISDKEKERVGVEMKTHKIQKLKIPESWIILYLGYL